MAAVEAVIVAGGLGTRLHPLTVHHPKHLLPVAGVPFVAHQIAKLAGSGVTRVVLATSYHHDRFEPVLGDGRLWGVELIYVQEKELRGTAGAIRNVAESLDSADDDPVVVLNGDILSDHDIGRQVQRHRDSDVDVTLNLVEVKDARAFGCVPTDLDDRVTAFHEKSLDPVTNQINAGCYVFRRRVIDEIPADRVVSVEHETFPGLLASGCPILGHLTTAYWRDLGTPASLVEGSSDLVRGIASSPAFSNDGKAWVHSSATVEDPRTVRGGSSVNAQAQVSARAVVDGSIVGKGAVIHDGARVLDSVVGDGAVIGRNVMLVDAAVGDNAVVGAHCELRDGARIWADAVIPDGAIRFSSRA